MLFAAAVLGGLAGWVVTQDEIGAIVGGIAAAVIAIVAERWPRATRAHRALPAAPVDLSASAPVSLTSNTYAAMPLAARNGTVARLVASASGADLAAVVALLPNLMQRKRAASPEAEQIRQAIMKSDRGISDDLRKNINAVCQGELHLAALASIPQTDRAVAFAQQSLGGPPTKGALRRAALKARLGTGQSLAELIDDTVAGDTDLAFAVATIRRVGELQAAEFKKIR